MSFNLIMISESHHSVMKSKESPIVPVGVLFVGQRDEKKKIVVPLFTFDSSGKAQSPRFMKEPYCCNEEFIDRVKQDFLKSRKTLPSFLYDVRVGKFVGIFGSDRQMKLCGPEKSGYGLDSLKS